MAKRSKFQAELLLRSLPPNAFDVLRETATRLQQTQGYPPGIYAAIGEILEGVIRETDQVKSIRDEDKRLAKLAIVDEDVAK